MRGRMAFDRSHVTRHTSHVTRHTSHITRHTSHVTRRDSPEAWIGIASLAQEQATRLSAI